MSLTLVITKKQVPENEQEALDFLDKVYNDHRKSKEPPSKASIALHKDLTARFPCISDSENGDDTIWSDGPLISNFKDDSAILGVSLMISAELNGIEFVFEKCTEHGFTVWDTGTDEIHRPNL